MAIKRAIKFAADAIYQWPPLFLAANRAAADRGGYFGYALGRSDEYGCTVHPSELDRCVDWSVKYFSVVK